MTINDLRTHLLEENARDKRLTILNFILVTIVSLILIGIAFYFFGAILIKNTTDGVSQVTSSEYGWYYKLAFAALLIGGIGYIVSKLLTLKKRPTQIEEFVSKVQMNKQASNVDEYVEYRITVPLVKVNLKLCPVNFVIVAFENEIKFYKLPIHTQFVPYLKTLLSGVNLSAVNQAKNELYQDDDGTIEIPLATYASANNIRQDESSAVTALKTKEEFSQFLQNDLSSSINQYEKDRVGTKKTTLIYGGLSVLLVIGFLGYIMYNAFTQGFESIGITTFIPIIAVFAVYYIIYYIFIRPKQMTALKSGEMEINTSSTTTFKTELFDKILKFMIPDSQYIMHGHVDYAEFMESGMFTQKNYKITGNDLVVGKFSGVPFQFCDLTVTHQKKMHKEGEAPNCALYGQFFIARFNKSFSTPVYIVPKTGVAGFFMNNEIELYIDTPGEKIELEDPEFMKMFKVYGGDQIEARYILTPALMERIKDLAIRTQGQYYISFYNNKITVANNSGKNNFEVGMFKSITKDDNKLLVDFYQDICDELAIINDLKLNVKIWN